MKKKNVKVIFVNGDSHSKKFFEELGPDVLDFIAATGKRCHKAPKPATRTQKVFVYRGQFAKLGNPDFRYINKSYTIDTPALLTDSLKEDFIKAMRQLPDSIGWELVGISCVASREVKIPVPQKVNTRLADVHRKQPKGERLPLAKGKLIWVNVGFADGGTTWLPAVITDDGSVYTAFEKLERDATTSPDDIKEFNINPFL